MLKDERLDKIMELLSLHKYLSVDFLVNHLHYSPATVRRDITQLEKMGYAKKSYGGICLNEHAKPIIIREHELTAEKAILCQHAAKLVEDHDTIFIAGSSTTTHLAKYLADKKDITVVTIDLRLAMSLEKMGIKTYCTGGLLCDGMLTGCLATATLKQLSYDVCFFSVSGISDDGELTVMTEDFGTLLQEVIRRSKKSVCLCVDSKIGKRAFFSIGNPDVITHIISNTPFRSEIVRQYAAAEFIVADL